MKHLYSLILFLIVFNTYAEEKYQKTFYQNGTIKSEGWTENNQKIKFWKFYYQNGTLKKEGSRSSRFAN